jgi:chromosome segregation ATPase
LIDKTDAIVAGISAVSGSGVALAVARFFLIRWIEQREKIEGGLRRKVEELGETCESRCATNQRELVEAKEVLRRDHAMQLESVRVEGITARDEMRKHFDMEFTRLSDVNHDLRRDMGIWMNKVENQGKQMDKVASSIDGLAEKVNESVTAVRELAARLEGAGHLRRITDHS